MFLLLIAGLSGALSASGQQEAIAPTRPVPAGKAPHMQIKVIKDTPEEKVYVVVFLKGDEVLSGLTDFAIEHKVLNAHFTGIGAASGATTAWLDIPNKVYRPRHTKEQVEVLSLVGDIAAYQGKPVVHMHTVLGHRDGSTAGGHVWELTANPTVEVFLTANSKSLEKRPDEASGIKLIDPAR
jgi:predicted DNA-binding protein with PD1-like motif